MQHPSPRSSIFIELYLLIHARCFPGGILADVGRSLQRDARRVQKTRTKIVDTANRTHDQPHTEGYNTRTPYYTTGLTYRDDRRWSIHITYSQQRGQYYTPSESKPHPTQHGLTLRTTSSLIATRAIPAYHICTRTLLSHTTILV